MQEGTSKLDIRDLLAQQKIFGFDFLFASLRPKDGGGNVKTPIYANGFTSDSVSIHEQKATLQLYSDPSNCKADLVGIILKEDKGLRLIDKQLVVLDIDCKSNKTDGVILYKKVLTYFNEHYGWTKEQLDPVTENTVSGGYHIFLSSNTIYPQQKIKVADGVEIEVFSSKRYIATSPSKGYSMMDGSNCVNFVKARELELSTIDLDTFCNKFSNAESNTVEVNAVDEINPSYTFDTVHFDKLTKTWDEFNRFTSGKTDRDWDGIASGSSYEYIRHNIMPIYCLFNKVDIFLDKIAEYGKSYIKQWSSYPEKWLKTRNEENRHILGRDARVRLYNVGYFIKKKSSVRESLIKDFVENHMKELFKHVMLVHQGVYYYNKKYKCYTYLEKNTFNSVVGMHYLTNLGMVLAPEQYTTLYDSFVIYSEMFASEDAASNYVNYDILRDISFRKQIPIVFLNGTLYITPTGDIFKEDYFDPRDKNLYTIQLDYDDNFQSIAEDSIVVDWFKTKFTARDLEFIQMFFGNLLVPSYNPSIMLVLYSYKGALGKSTLAKTLSSLFDSGARTMITALPVSKLNGRFGGSTLTKSLLNMTTELDDRIDSESFKSVISREKWEVEAKFENAKYEIPLAKHISMANDVPKISADGGVVRRLAAFELSEAKARPDIEPSIYEDLFISDARSLAAFMIEGLKLLREKSFCDLSNYYLVNYADKVKKMREFNSNVFEWLGMEGYRMIRDRGLINTDEAFGLYKEWCMSNGYTAVKLRTMVKYLMSSDDIELMDSGTKFKVKA